MKSLELLGQLAQAPLQDMMSQASMYVLPAKYEPFGLTPLEAAANECPLILGDISTLREVWGTAAVYESPDDPEAWASRIGQLIGDPRSRHNPTARCTERAARYRSDTMPLASIQLYEQLLSHSACVKPAWVENGE